VLVMKFGGSSVASARAIEWVAGIVKSRLSEQPVVVVSAMGKTTDRLLEAPRYAAQGSAYSAWRRLFGRIRPGLQSDNSSRRDRRGLPTTSGPS
jgi:aspartokinase